ncbi:MAG: CdvA-like protein [archaeon]
MVLQIDAAARFLGRTISDQYDTSIGKIVGISTDVRGGVTSFELELANGRFLNYPSSQIEILGEHALFIDDWRVEAKTLRIEMDIALKRIRALSDLHRRGEIQPEIYEDLRKQHDGNLTALQGRKDSLVKSLSTVSEDLDRQLRELEMFLANNKMQLASAEIDGQSYKAAVDALEKGLRRVLSSKNDVETHLSSLAGLTLGIEEPRLVQPIQTFAREPIVRPRSFPSPVFTESDISG